MKAAIVAGVLSVAVGIGAEAGSQVHAPELHVLMDTSTSTDDPGRFRSVAITRIGEWARVAAPGDQVTAWRMAGQGAPYPAVSE